MARRVGTALVKAFFLGARSTSKKKEKHEPTVASGGRHRTDHRPYGRDRGASILSLLIADPAYAQNELRQDLWRAGHAHAGVWLVLPLVALRYVDEATLSEGMRWVRWLRGRQPLRGRRQRLPQLKGRRQWQRHPRRRSRNRHQGDRLNREIDTGLPVVGHSGVPQALREGRVTPAPL
jgi:hypothetical protein